MYFHLYLKVKPCELALILKYLGKLLNECFIRVKEDLGKVYITIEPFVGLNVLNRIWLKTDISLYMILKIDFY